MKKWILRPFTYIAGGPALAIGFAIMAVTALLSYFSRTHFDGVLDTHIGAPTPAGFYALEPLTDWLCATIICYLAGVLFSKSRVRLIDIAGTTAFSRMPLLPAAVIAFALPENVSLTNLPYAAIIVGIIILLCTIWMVALMYQGLAVSANLRGAKAAAVFTGAVIVAEIVSKIMLYYTYKSF